MPGWRCGKAWHTRWWVMCAHYTNSYCISFCYFMIVSSGIYKKKNYIDMLFIVLRVRGPQQWGYLPGFSLTLLLEMCEVSCWSPLSKSSDPKRWPVLTSCDHRILHVSASSIQKFEHHAQDLPNAKAQNQGHYLCLARYLHYEEIREKLEKYAPPTHTHTYTHTHYCRVTGWPVGGICKSGR